MKKVFILLLMLIVPGILILNSCKKEYSCESCNPPTGSTNKPPLANAGADQTIMLPIDSVKLDGSVSYDPDGRIVFYRWTKISGPGSFNITKSDSSKTLVKTLIMGVYKFELTVTDNGRLSAKDTVQVTVNAADSNGCNISNRPIITAQLMPIGTLSKTREGIAVASAGNKILFAGGYLSAPFALVARVDIFDKATNTWSTAELSQPRSYITTGVLGNKIFFAGGIFSTGIATSRVDIYDAATNTWTTTELSIPRAIMAAATAGYKILFAGGTKGNFQYSNRVDIYDAASNSWSVSDLSDRTPTGTVGMSAAAVGNRIYFAGEASDWFAWDFGSISSTINIYDVTTNTWSTSNLSIPRGFMASIVVGTKIYWAGGLYKQPDDAFTNLVEIHDVNNDSSAFSCLFQPNAFSSAVQKNNQIVFFTAGQDMPTRWTGPPPVHNKFDILDINTNSWSIAVLPQSIYASSIVSVNNTIYVAGGFVNGVLSKQVWKLEF